MCIVKKSLRNYGRTSLSKQGTLVDPYETDLISEVLLTIETNIDDLSPQVIAYTTEKLLIAGARDVWTTPINMKKGRSGHLLSVLCTYDTRDPLIRIILKETTSLGVRVYQCERISCPRAFQEVPTPWGVVNVKFGRVGDEITNVHAEYEDCARLAREHNIALQTIFDEAHRVFWNEMAKVS
ncbi:hypothetical protein CYMTET_53784 [Cymbomonas tetramitiformis]|uniref:DUF111 family protein n=1 Tax=Cymbomonas tetramitiformis TaxID=36881 RepID=A0AAE0EPD5_9CHLO|nr:hypothetical protein CYMTET_53784 [Cymbomonas tetramitiformis]